jgi:WhiB family redox-sensing transcriptional regulator
VSALSRWNTDAACREHDPDMWFPTDARVVAAPVSICLTICTVRQDCLDYAIETKQRYGIWGGILLDGAAAGRLPTGGPVAVPAGTTDPA